MDVITPGFLGSSQNIQYRMKKLRPCVIKGPVKTAILRRLSKK